MKEWYYKLVKSKYVRKIVNLISFIIRILAIIDATLISILQLDIFDKIIIKLNNLLQLSLISNEVKTNLYLWLAIFIVTELLLRGIRYILKPEISLFKSEKNKLKKLNKELNRKVQF